MDGNLGLKDKAGIKTMHDESYSLISKPIHFPREDSEMSESLKLSFKVKFDQRELFDCTKIKVQLLNKF